MVLKILKEALNGWFFVVILLFIVGILSLVNKTLGIWAGRVIVVVIILFFILGILSFFVPVDQIFKKK